MKVLFVVRSTLYTAKGGDTVQVIETAANLRALGIDVEIKPANEKIDYTPYTILHFFNITRPADILVHIKRSAKPFVISPILIDYSEYDRQQRPGLAGKIFRSLPTTNIEYLKTLYRALRRKDSLVSISYLWKGQRQSIKEILQRTEFVLANADAEYEQLVKPYNLRPKKALVPNGIDDKLFKKISNVEREPDLVICVARIEGIKNQYNLIKALNNTAYRLILIGNAAPNQQKYYVRCKKIAASNVSFIAHLPQEELLKYYTAAKVHVLPSWFEVCGLSSLEAAAMGCSIVITDKGYANAYFGNEAIYCDPSSPLSIFNAIENAAGGKQGEGLMKRVGNDYTWRSAAEKVLSVYKTIGS